MAMTKEQWDQVEQEMKGGCGHAELSLEGRRISLHKRFVKENQLAILVFIDGTIQMGWGWPCQDDFDAFVQKVWRKRSVALYKPSEKARIIKNFGKRKAKEYFPKLDEKREYWVPDFNTASSLRRLLQKNKEIELIRVGFNAETA